MKVIAKLICLIIGHKWIDYHPLKKDIEPTHRICYRCKKVDTTKHRDLNE